MPAPKSRKKDAPAPEQLPDAVVAALETLHQGVVLQRERLQEVVDDAVRRGRMTRADAEDLVQSLVTSGRRQAEDLYAEMERFVGRGRRAIVSGVGGGGPGFPIAGYDELTGAQVQKELAGLGPAELRQVRDHERRHAKRKGVLAAIEKHLK
jgi:hypothetical protein